MNYLIKISYMHDGFSSWQHEKEPVPLYASMEEAYKQICSLFLKEIHSISLNESILEEIQGLISNEKYYQACQEINTTNIIRFGILPTQISNDMNKINQNKFNSYVKLNKTDNNMKYCSGAGSASCMENAPSSGATCRKCKQVNSYASANSGDGTYICFACR